MIYDEPAIAARDGYPVRDWEYSQLDTTVQPNGRAELSAFLNIPMRGLRNRTL